MNENQPNPTLVEQTEPDDPTWYLQRMYDMTGETTDKLVKE